MEKIAAASLPTGCFALTKNLSPDQALYIYRVIEKLIKKSFEKCDESTSCVELDFDSVKQCLGILKDHFSETRLMWKTTYLLFQYFEKYRSTELLPRIADVLYFINYDTIYKRNVFGGLIDPLQTEKSVFPSLLDDGYSLEKHNCVWKLMKEPYRNDLTEIVPKAQNLVWLAAEDVETHRLLPILLRQGLMYMPPSSHEHEWVYCNQVLRSICCFTERHLHGFDLAMGFRPSTVENKLDAHRPTTKRRIFTLFRAMNVVQRKMSKLALHRTTLERESKSNFVDRFRMIFDTIPEPLVTLREVRLVLEKLFLPSDNNKIVIDIFCEWFVRLMPESMAPLTPRSLKHLSRCQVRDNLRRMGKFPYHVYSLPIPSTLKEDLLLEHWFPSNSFESENEDLSFFEEKTSCRSSLAQQYFDRRFRRDTSMLDIMKANYNREVKFKFSANKKRR